MALSSHWLWKEKYIRKEKNVILVFLSNWHYLMESNLCCAKVCRKVWEELDEGAIQQILFYEMLWLNKGQTKNSAISHIAHKQNFAEIHTVKYWLFLLTFFGRITEISRNTRGE